MKQNGKFPILVREVETSEYYVAESPEALHQIGAFKVIETNVRFLT